MSLVKLWVGGEGHIYAIFTKQSSLLESPKHSEHRCSEMCLVNPSTKQLHQNCFDGDDDDEEMYIVPLSGPSSLLPRFIALN